MILWLEEIYDFKFDDYIVYEFEKQGKTSKNNLLL
jgi:hypothetical protein